MPTAGPDDSASRRRREIALTGFSRDEERARLGLVDPSPKVRRAALYALVRMGALTAPDLYPMLADSSPDVRRAACELASALPGEVEATAAGIAGCLADPDASVVEAAAFAAGELGASVLCGRLVEIATGHPDPLCRESAVAALGAIGDPAGRDALLASLEDVPAVRRRAVIALSAHSGEEVLLALRARLSDRDWQVRQAAEDVLALSDEPPS